MAFFDELGGSAKCRALSAAFYARVAKDETLRPLFPGKSMKCPIEEFSAFLVQFLGGPSEDARRRWWLSLQESHQRFQIRQKERDAWLDIMKQTLNDVQLAEPTRAALRELFDQASGYLVNSGPSVSIGSSRGDSEIQSRWEQQRALDEAIAVLKRGDLHQTIAMIEGAPLSSYLERNRSVFANLIGLMVKSSHSALASHARQVLLRNPDLARQRYSDRTLLHAASAAGNLPMVVTLLEMGGHANVQDGGGHTPLYSVGNECPGGASIVRALIQAGAEVDACSGVKRCTALHMAARRGNAEAAEALLDCGANIEARDSLGETPLRRAVNCSQPEVAALLLARGANPNSVGSKGLTPLSAARSARMRELFRNRATR